MNSVEAFGMVVALVAATLCAAVLIAIASLLQDIYTVLMFFLEIWARSVV